MTKYDLQLEKHFKAAAARPQRKLEDTLTSFDRDIFWYDRDEVNRQLVAPLEAARVTYEDHRKVIETAVNMMRASTQKDIAMTILTHRYFANYRASVFKGTGNFHSDYSFLLKRIGMVFDYTNNKVINVSIASKLAEFKEPELVQINHIVGLVTKVVVPSANFTLQEWASKYNLGANESTSYRVAGLKVG